MDIRQKWNALSKTAKAKMLRANRIVVSTKDDFLTTDYLTLPHRVKVALEFDLEHSK